MKEYKIENLTRYYKKQGLTDRQVNNRLKKEEAQEQTEKNQKQVKKMTITIEWKKSSTWGNNPNATAEVHFKDGTLERSQVYKCSGCGYDKESTVIAQIFNDYLRYKLWEIEDAKHIQKGKPYGIRLNYEFSPYYEGGVGANCYYSISEFICGKFEHIAGGNTFDVYQYTE